MKIDLENLTPSEIQKMKEDGVFVNPKTLDILNEPFVFKGLRANERLMMKLNEFYLSGQLYLPDFSNFFGLRNRDTFAEIFKKLELPRPSISQIWEMYRSDIEARRVSTFRKNHGTDYPMQSTNVKEKAIETNIKKYGFAHPLQNAEVYGRLQSTNVERYGTTNPFASPEIKRKIAEKVLKTFGVANVSQSDEIKEKKRLTCFERYGVDSASSLPRTKERQREGRARNDERFRKTLEISRKDVGNLSVEDIVHFDSYGYCSKLIYLKELGFKEPTEYSTELKIKAFLESLGISFIQNARKAHGVKKSPKAKHYYDADFLIPDQKLVIEVNGLAYHSVNRSANGNRKTKDYHFNKFKAFYDAGYRMISFTDYELKNFWSSVTEIIKFHLGFLESLSESTKVEYQEFLGYPIEESLNYGFFNKNNPNSLNFENFRLPEDFIVPRTLDGWEYWDCGRV